MSRISFFCLSLLTLVANLHAHDYAPHAYSVPGGKIMPYQLLIPPHYDKTKTYPVILFFHGSAERGVDNIAQLKWVAKDFIEPDFQSRHPCFVIVPQCPVDQSWVDMNFQASTAARTPQPSGAMQMALKILDDATTEFSIDRSRIYIAGISMGGYAVWDCITRYPDRFAAGIVCCGGGDESAVTAAAARVPIWVFHSTDDPVVPVVRDRNMVAAMVKMGGHPHYTEYSQGLGHNCWVKAFADPGLIPWLFHQQLGQPASP